MITRSRPTALSLPFLVSAIAVAYLTALPWTPPARPEQDLALAHSRKVQAVTVGEPTSAFGVRFKYSQSSGEPGSFAARPGLSLSAPTAILAHFRIEPPEGPSLVYWSLLSPRVRSPYTDASSARSPPAA